jgi:hypothetical protein
MRARDLTRHRLCIAAAETDVKQVAPNRRSLRAERPREGDVPPGANFVIGR